MKIGINIRMMEQQATEETYESALLALRCRHLDSQLSLKTPVDERTTSVHPKRNWMLDEPAMISVQFKQ